MSLKFAIAGFRHGHIYDVCRRVNEADGMEVVAACEEDADARKEVDADAVKITHDNFDKMLAEADCDIVGIGDYFAKRGSLVIKALEAGKHVIGDKPLCTDLDEVAQIERLSAEKGLKVGCQLDLRALPNFIGLRDVVRSGAIGEVHAIAFGGQHPLNLGQRPGWYFETGKHGGTITDIGIHAIDMIPWITGLKFKTCSSARCWNAFAPEFPHFKGAAQLMLTMDNGCGVLGDVSYFMPNTQGYANPLYWRVTLFGRKGIAETSCNTDSVTMYLDGEEKVITKPLPQSESGAYLRDFVKDIEGSPVADGLNTETVLRTVRTVVTIQKAADENAHDVEL